MRTIFHLFCKNKIETETASIKAVVVTGIAQVLPAKYHYEVEYKDGRKETHCSGAKTLIDKYAQYLDDKFVRELHDEINEIRQRNIEDLEGDTKDFDRLATMDNLEHTMSKT